MGVAAALPQKGGKHRNHDPGHYSASFGGGLYRQSASRRPAPRTAQRAETKSGVDCRAEGAREGGGLGGKDAKRTRIGVSAATSGSAMLLPLVSARLHLLRRLPAGGTG